MLKLPYRPDHRHIIRRVIVRGTLVLDTPTCLGTGDSDSPTDMPLSRDNLERNKALLTGSSIAGALRNYLREYNKKYGHTEERDDLTTKLFGDLFAYENESNKDEAEKIALRERNIQSPLIINDSISTKPIQSELRDGVRINSITRTAAAQAKYDLELLQAGTEFPLCFELLIEKNSNESELRKGLAIALSGLEQGEISLGMKKRRGFGRCHIKEWQVWNFDLTKPDQRREWLEFDHWTLGFLAKAHQQGQNIAHLLGVTLDSREDKRDRFTINATFTLASPLLIRSGQAETGRAPDVVHLKSTRIINEVKYFLASCLHQQIFSRAIAWFNLLPQEITVWTSKNLELFLLAYFLLQPSRSQLPILSGTSLAGVLRHRAERIVKTLQCSFGQNPECGKEPEIIKSIFGHVENKRSQASRLVVHESIIHHTTDLVQTRIAIDRFTGGAYHGALFQEQPIFSNDKKTELKLEIELRNPQQYEIGLLLLLLKDLWTEDLPVGGSSNIGRGRLKGKKATMTWKDSTWIIETNGDNPLKITSDNANENLQKYVSKLVKNIKGKNNNEPSNSKNIEILTRNWQPMSWQDFQQLGNQAEYENGRFYYDHGYMKIEMSPLGINHSRDNSVVARLISLFATLKNIQVVEFTNVSLRKAQIQESQPDSTFYLEKISNLPPRSNEPIDLNQYVPPSLVIEIASTTLSDDLGQKRLLYERLGVREYWVINSNDAKVTAFEMMDGGSRETRVSQVLPSLQISVVEEALERSRTSDDGEVNRWLIQLFSQ